MADRDIELRLTAKDDASKVIGKVADEIDGLDDADIEIGADTRDAETNIQRFERELDALTNDSGRELRIDFKEQVLQQKIRSTLRALERLDDPVDIQVKQDELETAQRDLNDLADLASKKYDVDIDVDQKGNTRRAADDFERLDSATRGTNETVQSGIGPLRGFTDELGGAAQAGGTAGNAIIDAGEAIEIFGAKAGLSEASIAKVSGALGAVGIAVTVGATAWGLWNKSQQEARERTEENTRSLVDQAGAVDLISDKIDDLTDRDPFLAQLIGDDDDKLDAVVADLATLGQNIDDVGAVAAQARGRNAGYFRSLLEGRGIVGDAADEFVRLYEAGQQINIGNLKPALGIDQSDVDLARGLQRAYNDLGDVDFPSFEEAARELAVLTNNQQRLNDLVDQGEEWPAIYQAMADASADAADATEGVADAATIVEREIARAESNFKRFGTSAKTATDEADSGLKNVDRTFTTLSDKLQDRKNVDGLLDNLQDVEDKFFEAFTAGSEGAADATEKIRAAEDAQLDLRIEVAQYGEEVANLPPEVITYLDTQINQGNLQVVRDTLRALQTPLYVPLDIVTRVVNDTGYPIPPISGGAGGNVDFGPQGLTNVTVNMPRTADPRDITAQLNRWERVNGSPF